MATAMSQDILHASLGVPTDDMEISSDFGRRDYDDNIDIEIDFDDDAQENEEDYMIEDDAADRSGQFVHNDSTYTGDDEMYDDDLDLDEEHDMVDHTTNEEELVDANVDYEVDHEGDTEIVEGNDIFDNAYEIVDENEPSGGPSSSTLFRSTENQRTELPNVNDIDTITESEAHTYDQEPDLLPRLSEEIEQSQQTFFQQNHLGSAVSLTDENPTSAAALDDGGHDHKDLTGLEFDSQTVHDQDEPHAAEPPVESQDVENHAITGFDETLAQAEANVGEAKGEVEGEGEVEQNNGESPSHESQFTSDSRYHPVIVRYGGAEVELLPPRDEESSMSCLLTDRSIVNTSLQELLGHCREALGDIVEENDELEIEVAVLGVRISEDSHSASQFSLADILDVFVQLCQNDGVETPDPLYINLITKPKFTARMAEWSVAISQGLGLSYFGVASEKYNYYDSDKEELAEDTAYFHEEEENLTDPHFELGEEAEGAEAQLEGPAHDEAETEEFAHHGDFQPEINIDSGKMASVLAVHNSPSWDAALEPSTDKSGEHVQHAVEETVAFEESALEQVAHDTNESTQSSDGLLVYAPTVEAKDNAVALLDEEGDDLLDYSEEDDANDANEVDSLRSSTLQGDESGDVTSEQPFLSVNGPLDTEVNENEIGLDVLEDDDESKTAVVDDLDVYATEDNTVEHYDDVNGIDDQVFDGAVADVDEITFDDDLEQGDEDDFPVEEHLTQGFDRSEYSAYEITDDIQNSTLALNTDSPISRKRSRSSEDDKVNGQDGGADAKKARAV